MKGDAKVSDSNEKEKYISCGNCVTNVRQVDVSIAVSYRLSAVRTNTFHESPNASRAKETEEE